MRASWLALGLVAAMWLLALVSGYDVVGDVDITHASAGPSAAHWLGTDHLGRDVFWRLVTGSRAFVGPGVAAACVALGLGLAAGALAGWSGGLVAVACRYVFTVVASVPRFVLVLLACAIYGNSVWTLAVAAGVAYAPTVGEEVYARMQAFRRAEFVLAAEAHGVHPARILGYHLLWVNTSRLAARHALQLFAFLLLVETTLSYIGAFGATAGFGVQEPTPSWGNMMGFEWGVPDANAWATAAPALALWSVLVAALGASQRLDER